MAIPEGNNQQSHGPIGYINQEIPEFKLPPVNGKHYDATVPDTLELQDRAQLALHCMTETTDPEADYEPYYVTFFNLDPPRMVHNSWHGSTLPKYIESVALMRVMTGSQQNADVDHRWVEATLKMQGSDGLLYSPAKGRPWADQEAGGLLFADFGVEISDDQYISAFGNGRMLSTLSLLAQRDNTPLWRDSMRRIIDGLEELAVHSDDIAYFWPTVTFSQKGFEGSVQTPSVNCETSRIPHGLVHAYRLLGYKPALTLAGKLVNYMRRYFYAPDGTFWSSPGNPYRAHFHAHSHGLLAMMEYAIAAENSEVMEFVVRAFEWAKSLGANYKADGWDEWVKIPAAELIGYFTTYTNTDRQHGSELCQVSDMIALALKLSEAGIGDYWDDADRWLRNMLVEGQLTSSNWADELTSSNTFHVGYSYFTTASIAERNVGAFASWPSANDWSIHDLYGCMHCCTVNGARALYWIWDACLRHNEGVVRVNLLLNRASPWADVDSHIPYQGRVDVKIKQPVDLEMRIPDWVKPREVCCTVDDSERRLKWNGRYAEIGAVKPGDMVTMTFPITEQTDQVYIEKDPYTLIRKGNDVVSIDPPGRHYPLYQRENYRADETCWRSLKRFVTNERIDV